MDSLGEGNDLSNALRRNSALAWNQLSQFPDTVQPDSFDCHVANGSIMLGRSGGNTGATVSIDGGKATIFPHNAESHAMVMLIVIQLAMIEGAYRRAVE
jgi:hypothetical protein